MNITTYHVNAFASHLFAGNPAMVCILKHWLPDSTLQLIATENNLPATAFLVQDNTEFSTRWFTPEYEIDLCGHGTLASGYVIFNHLEPTLQKITLHFPGGILQIRRDGECIILDFPIKNIATCSSSSLLEQGLGTIPAEVYHYKSERCLTVFHTEEEIKQLKPNMQILKKLDYRGIIVTAPGTICDFVSRVFYPHKSMSEDAVTGSSHCLLVPYWANRLNKTQFQSRQLSSRGGELACELEHDRVIMRGKVVIYMQGTIALA